jgi:hypothetical protein
MTLLSNEVEKVRARDFFQLPVDILWPLLQSEAITTPDGLPVVSGRSWPDGSGYFFVRSAEGTLSLRENMEEVFLVPRKFLQRHKNHFLPELEYPLVSVLNKGGR